MFVMLSVFHHHLHYSDRNSPYRVPALALLNVAGVSACSTTCSLPARCPGLTEWQSSFVRPDRHSVRTRISPLIVFGDWERRGRTVPQKIVPLEHFSRRKVQSKNRSAAPASPERCERGMFNRTCTRIELDIKTSAVADRRGAVPTADDEATHKNRDRRKQRSHRSDAFGRKSDALYVPPAGKYFSITTPNCS